MRQQCDDQAPPVVEKQQFEKGCVNILGVEVVCQMIPISVLSQELFRALAVNCSFFSSCHTLHVFCSFLAGGEDTQGLWSLECGSSL